jgi:hypothetical protein
MAGDGRRGTYFAVQVVFGYLLEPVARIDYGPAAVVIETVDAAIGING